MKDPEQSMLLSLEGFARTVDRRRLLRKGLLGAFATMASLAFGSVVWACTASREGARTDDCVEPTAITPFRGDASRMGAQVGPISIGGFGTKARAIEDDFNTRVLYKHFIWKDPSLGSLVRLKGMACSDRRPLRFWYRGGVPMNLPATEQELATTGDLIAELRLGTEARSGENAIGWPGYILYSRPGSWRVMVSVDSVEVGSIIILVREPGASGT